MRETRQSGSEGGGAEIKIGSPYPYQDLERVLEGSFEPWIQVFRRR